MTLCARCQRSPVPMSGRSALCRRCGRSYGYVPMVRQSGSSKVKPVDLSTEAIERRLLAGDARRRRARWVA